MAEIIDELMNALTQSEMWSNIFGNDPAIMKACNRWNRALERVKELIPRDLYMELSDAESSEAAAIVDAAILFGIHVADAIADHVVLHRPVLQIDDHGM